MQKTYWRCRWQILCLFKNLTDILGDGSQGVTASHGSLGPSPVWPTEPYVPILLFQASERNDGRRVHALQLSAWPARFEYFWNHIELFNISCKNAILVFDEAHNVASTSEDCNSIELSTVVLGAAIEQLSALKEAMLKSARGIKSKAKVTLQTTKNYDETVHHDPEQN